QTNILPLSDGLHDEVFACRKGQQAHKFANPFSFDQGTYTFKGSYSFAVSECMNGDLPTSTFPNIDEAILNLGSVFSIDALRPLYRCLRSCKNCECLPIPS